MINQTQADLAKTLWEQSRVRRSRSPVSGIIPPWFGDKSCSVRAVGQFCMAINTRPKRLVRENSYDSYPRCSGDGEALRRFAKTLEARALR